MSSWGIAGCLGPDAEQLMPLRVREQGKIREPAPGIGDDGFQQVSERRPPCDRSSTT